MSRFHIINESTEDTLESTDSLEDAIQVAREAANRGEIGEPVSVLESGGLTVRQFVRMPDGTVVEQAVTQPGKY
jgi:hypothetical protein